MNTVFWKIKHTQQTCDYTNQQYMMHNLGKHTRQLYLPDGGSGRSSNDRCFLASVMINEHVYAHEALFEESPSCDKTNHFSKKFHMRQNEAYLQITRAEVWTKREPKISDYMITL